MEKIVKINGETKNVQIDLSRCCATCLHFEVRPDVTGATEKVGDCRVDYPKVMLLPRGGMVGGAGVEIRPVFPLMLGSQWCAHHPQRRADVLAIMFDKMKTIVETDMPLIRSFLNR